MIQSGTIDKLYCAFILAQTAASLDMEVHAYFTFFGLMMLRKGEMDKTGLPATYKHLEGLMMEKLKEMKYPTPYEMLKATKATGNLKIYACTPTMEMFNIKREDLVPEVDEMAGAATFLSIATEADMSLFI